MTAKREDIRMGLPDSKNQVRENKVKLEGAFCKQAKCKNDDWHFVQFTLSNDCMKRI